MGNSYKGKDFFSFKMRHSSGEATSREEKK